MVYLPLILTQALLMHARLICLQRIHVQKDIPFRLSLKFCFPDTHFSSEVQYYKHVLPSDLVQLLVVLWMLLHLV